KNKTKQINKNINNNNNKLFRTPVQNKNTKTTPLRNCTKKSCQPSPPHPLAATTRECVNLTSTTETTTTTTT
uniref:Uncharacterized protein n=1 Tax=Anopheles arabiensis TaxID=7173 RepID=A0A182IHZ1_ANOAR